MCCSDVLVEEEPGDRTRLECPLGDLTSHEKGVVGRLDRWGWDFE